MVWWVRVADDWRSCDELTVDEIIAVETVSGQAWAFLSPLTSAPVAKSLLATFLVRDGATDEDAAKTVGALSVGKIRHIFRYREDDDLPDTWEDGLPVVDPKPEAGTGTA